MPPMSERPLTDELPPDPSRPPNFDAEIDPNDLPQSAGDGEGGEAQTQGEEVEQRQQQTREDRAAVEAEARDMGWIAKDQFRGDKGRWVDAGTYVKRAKEVLPIIKAREAKTTAENEELKRQIAALQQGQKQADEERAQRADAQRKFELASLKQRRKVALENQDMDAVNDIDVKLIEINSKPATVTPPATTPPPNPQTQAQWSANVSKYPFLAAKEAEEDWHAEGLALRFAGNKEVGQAFIDRVNLRMKRLYPEHFTTRRRAMVEGGGSPSGGNDGGGSRTFDNLKAGYKNEWNKNGHKMGMTKVQFLAECDADCFED